MRTTQGSMLQSLRAVQAFLDQNATRLTGVVSTGTRRQLNAAITDLAAHVALQSGSTIASQGATQTQHSLREVLLRDHMAPIVRIARANLPPTPALEPFKMPSGRPTAERLAQIARGMGEAALPFSATFIEMGLPEDFINQLRHAADAMLLAIDDRMQIRGVRGGATKGLKAKLSSGRKIVHVLDAFVQSALKDDLALLASWNIVKRVQKNPGRSGPDTPPASTPTTPAPTPSPATVAPSGPSVP